jgi:hypothetical protein
MNKLVIPPVFAENMIAEEYALPAFLQNQPAALIVAHPGHELLVHGWLSLARSALYVLTDGSGHSGRSRLQATTSLLNAIGASPGCIYGRFTDAQFYRALLNQDVALFTSLASELAEDLARRRIAYVVGDTIEGYNPTHDICRLLINAAVEMAQRAGGQQLDNYGFAVVTRADATRPQSIRLRLDDRAFSDKLAAARAYAEWVADVDDTLKDAGAESFRDEYLHAINDQEDRDAAVAEPPFYEQYGEKLVAAGYYQEVLRYRQHILPIKAALREYVEMKSQ